MAMMVSDARQFLRSRSKPADKAVVALMAPRAAGMIDPAAIRILYAAIRRAWQLIVVLEPSSPARRTEVIDALAEGALRAAGEGERDVDRLSHAACWYFITGTADR
jgi:hypothetical protein